MRGIDNVTAVNARASKMAKKGRYGDTEMAHVTPGEIVLPRETQTPDVMGTVASEFDRQGIPLSRYTVQDTGNSQNPDTGKNEFFLKSLIKIAAPVVGGMIGGPPGAAVGSAIGGLIGGDGAPSGGATAAGGGGGQVLPAPIAAVNQMKDPQSFLKPLPGFASLDEYMSTGNAYEQGPSATPPLSQEGETKADTGMDSRSILPVSRSSFNPSTGRQEYYGPSMNPKTGKQEYYSGPDNNAQTAPLLHKNRTDIMNSYFGVGDKYENPSNVGKATQTTETEKAASAAPASFDSNAYYDANPDVKESGMDAWKHYSTYGKDAGRKVSKDLGRDDNQFIYDQIFGEGKVQAGQNRGHSALAQADSSKVKQYEDFIKRYQPDYSFDTKSIYTNDQQKDTLRNLGYTGDVYAKDNSNRLSSSLDQFLAEDPEALTKYVSSMGNYKNYKPYTPDVDPNTPGAQTFNNDINRYLYEKFGGKGSGEFAGSGLEGIDYFSMNPQYLDEYSKTRGLLDPGYKYQSQSVLPQDWNEQEYLRMNPDVALKVAAGQYDSGAQHYYSQGAKEGRQYKQAQPEMPSWLTAILESLQGLNQSQETAPQAANSNIGEIGNVNTLSPVRKPLLRSRRFSGSYGANF